MLHYKVGNLLDASQICIAHQVNCQGVMGSGVAKAIKEKYPKAYEHYKGYCNVRSSKDLLGISQEVHCRTTEEERVVINLFGQQFYGYDGCCYTSYVALTIALDSAFKFIVRENDYYGDPLEIAVPYKMGCDRGGGDWKIVSKILEELSDKYDVDVYIYSLTGY
jgi:O-acetyl-ADP-ribose deacetylase (regulator of RNase III)